MCFDLLFIFQSRASVCVSDYVHVCACACLWFVFLCTGHWDNKINTQKWTGSTVETNHKLLVPLLSIPKGGRGFLMSPPVRNLRAVSLIPLFYNYVLSCSSALVLLLFLSCPFLLLVHSPDLFFPKPPSPKSRLFCVAFVVFLFVWAVRRWVGYFSWWYVQYMLPYATRNVIYGVGTYIYLSFVASWEQTWRWSWNSDLHQYAPCSRYQPCQGLGQRLMQASEVSEVFTRPDRRICTSSGRGFMGDLSTWKMCLARSLQEQPSDSRGTAIRFPWNSHPIPVEQPSDSRGCSCGLSAKQLFHVLKMMMMVMTVHL